MPDNDKSDAPDKVETTTLYHPDGREYEAVGPREVTRLKARGYSEDKPEKADKGRSRQHAGGSSGSSGDSKPGGDKAPGGTAA